MYNTKFQYINNVTIDRCNGKIRSSPSLLPPLLKQKTSAKIIIVVVVVAEPPHLCLMTGDFLL